jgi:hypothetical protein
MTAEASSKSRAPFKLRDHLRFARRRGAIHSLAPHCDSSFTDIVGEVFLKSASTDA